MAKTLHEAIIRKLIGQFKEAADAEIASGMEAYLRNQFSAYGIKSTLRREISKPIIRELVALGPDYIEKITRNLYAEKKRELHYVGMEYLAACKRIWKGDELPLIEFLVRTHSWWDTVDFIASNILGPYFQRFPKQLPPAIKSWNAQDDFWLHRCSIIFQLKYYAKTDEALLFAQCSRYAHEKEFFIRKAIGWALRQHSKYAPDSVRKFIEIQPLSALSLKEAGKYI